MSSTQTTGLVDQLERLHEAMSRPRTATVEETAAALVHAARGASDPHLEAAAIVRGLWSVECEYSRDLLAAIYTSR